jgi:hypothetical protein
VIKVAEAIVDELHRQGFDEVLVDIRFDAVALTKAVIKAADGDVVPMTRKSPRPTDPWNPDGRHGPNVDFLAFDGAVAPELENRVRDQAGQGETGPAEEAGGVRANRNIGIVVAALVAFFFHDVR